MQKLFINQTEIREDTLLISLVEDENNSFFYVPTHMLSQILREHFLLHSDAVGQEKKLFPVRFGSLPRDASNMEGAIIFEDKYIGEFDILINVRTGNDHKITFYEPFQEDDVTLEGKKVKKFLGIRLSNQDEITIKDYFVRKRRN